MANPHSIDKTVAQEKFDEARIAQQIYWDALSALEDEIGIEVDDNQDLSETTLEDLIEEGN